LTNFEKRQPDAVFVSAGKKAYLMAIHVQNNPYFLKPFRSLWEKGYRSAKRQVESGLHPSPYTRPTDNRNNRADRQNDRRQNQHPKYTKSNPDHRQPQDHKAKRGPGNFTKPSSNNAGSKPGVKQGVKPGVKQGVHAKTSTKANQPVISLGRIEKFNNKYRTQV
jgi:hypothetical protein